MKTSGSANKTFLGARIAEAREQLAAMRAKQRRLTEAIRQREQHILRLEATAALCRTLPPARICHE